LFIFLSLYVLLSYSGFLAKSIFVKFNTELFSVDINRHKLGFTYVTLNFAPTLTIGQTAKIHPTNIPSHPDPK
jgi:hypothetical protein